MQRRAAAIYFAFFLVLGAGSYGYLTVADAQQPTISLENAENYSQGDFLTVDGRTYVISEISEENASEGEGKVFAGALKWTNQSAIETATLENGTNTTYQNVSWQVQIANGSDVSEFALRENINVSAVLAADDRVDNETVTREGEPNVVFRSNNSLQPLDEYLREPRTQSFSEGDTFEYTAEESVVNATVDSVTANASTPSVTLTWEVTEENTIELTEGANVTLKGDQMRVVHFVDNETVQLSTDVGSYQNQVAQQDYFHERKAGLWGITIISSMAAIILLGTAYLPVKD